MLPAFFLGGHLAGRPVENLKAVLELGSIEVESGDVDRLIRGRGGNASRIRTRVGAAARCRKPDTHEDQENDSLGIECPKSKRHAGILA
jgi:hypothetical protein